MKNAGFFVGLNPGGTWHRWVREENSIGRPWCYRTADHWARVYGTHWSVGVRYFGAGKTLSGWAKTVSAAKEEALRNMASLA